MDQNKPSLDQAIKTILRRYKVHIHEADTKFDGPRMYAVWAGDNGERRRQVSTTMPRADAMSVADNLMSDDLIKLFQQYKHGDL